MQVRYAGDVDLEMMRLCFFRSEEMVSDKFPRMISAARFSFRDCCKTLLSSLAICLTT